MKKMILITSLVTLLTTDLFAVSNESVVQYDINVSNESVVQYGIKVSNESVVHYDTNVSDVSTSSIKTNKPNSNLYK